MNDDKIIYFILGGFILLGILGIFAGPVISDIPPTPAFKMINTTTANVTAQNYADFVSFEGIGMTIAPDYDLKKITFTASPGGLSSIHQIGNVTERGCAQFQYLSVNSTGFFV